MPEPSDETTLEKPYPKFTRGQLIELSPACDLWMRGARFGNVVKQEGRIVTVKMHHRQVKKLQRFDVDYIMPPPGYGVR